MSAKEMEARMDQLSEAMVMTDIADLPGLAGLHTQLESLSKQATEAGLNRCVAALLQAAGMVEGIVLQELPDPASALDMVGRIVGVLQQVVRDGRPETEVEFPIEISGETASPATVFGVEGYTITLPAYVDETIFAEFLGRQESVLEEMESNILTLEKAQDTPTLASLKRQFHTLKGESALLGLNDIESLCHAAEDLMVDGLAAGVTDRLLAVKDWVKRAFDAITGAGPAPESPGPLLEQLRTAKTTTGPAPEAPHPQSTTKPPLQEVAAAAPDPPPAEAHPLTGDRELLGEFILEATEHLDTADLQLLTLETDSSNAGAINSVFRAFHTIKGVAGFLALDEVGALSHESENLLDMARKNQLVLTGPAIDVVFDAVDMLKQMIALVRNSLESGALLPPVPGLQALLSKLRLVAQGKAEELEEAPPEAGVSKLGDILVAQGAATPEAVAGAARRQSEPASAPKLGEVLRSQAVICSRDIDDALDMQQHEGAGMKLGEVLVEMGRVSTDQVEGALEKQNAESTPPRIGEILVSAGDASAKDVAQALRTQQGQRSAQTETMQLREAVKVDADRLDLLVDMIGELVIAESMVVQSEELRSVASTALTRHMTLLDKITRELQEMAMSLRMVPIRATFQKMARLVRDLAKKTDKAVEFTMSGEDTELDKTVVDKIGDPLVHMVRNAVDHGLEDTSGDRLLAGKPGAGTVHLAAFHEGGNIHIQISDDGRGLNREAILAKAVERGLIKEGDHLSDREIWDLIFEPGFSTAKQITAVSGRGVGMDVVRKNIEALRGQVIIDSQAGKGSVFTIVLPLTLAIIDGMVVRVGRERYILPTLSILLSIRPSAKDLSTVARRGEMLMLHGDLLPLFRLHRLLGIDNAITELTAGTVVVVEKAGGRVGLLVDEILGQQQIVIKSLGDSLQGLPGIAGGAIMPDGQVGLILDVGGLVRLATQQQV